MKRFLALLLCIVLLLCGCATDPGAYVPTGDGLSYGDDYTGPQHTPVTEEKQQDLTLPYYK